MSQSVNTPSLTGTNEVPRLMLQDFLEDRDPDFDVTVERDIEKMVASGNYQQAHDLYTSTTIDTPPEDYDDFLAGRVLTSDDSKETI